MGERAGIIVCCMAVLCLGAGCSDAQLELADIFLQGVFEGVFEDLEVDGARVTAGAATYWHVPSEMRNPGTYWGGHLDYYFANRNAPPDESIFGFGMGYYGDGKGADLFTGLFFWDVGRVLSRAGGRRNPAAWVIVRPEVGFWIWSEAHEDESGRSGPLTGITLGVARMYPVAVEGGSPYLGIVSAQYRLERVNNVVGNEDATVGKLEISYTWRW